MKIHESKWHKYILVASLACILSRAAGVIAAYLLGCALDGAVSKDAWTLITLAIYSVSAYALVFILDILASRSSTFGANGIAHSIGNRLLKRFFDGAITTFRQKDDAYYINTLTSDIESIRINRYASFSIEIGYAAETLIALCVLLYISPWMFLVSILLAFVPMATSRIYTRFIQARVLARSKAAEKYVGVVTEAVQGYETIKLAGSPNGYFQRFNDVSRCFYNSIYRDKSLRDVAYRTARSLAAVSVLAGTVTGGYLVLLDQMTIGELLASINIFSYVSDGIGNFIETRMARRGTNTIWDKIDNEFSGLEKPVSGETTASIIPEVEYKNVTFSFKGKDILCDFSFSFKPGCIYALLGESGSGKSTFYRILMKFFNEYSGTISIDGRDIRDIPEYEMYKLIGVVPQNAYLLNDTLENNVTLYDKGACDAGLILADLSLQPLVNRVENRPLGDFGDNISGGERQRISIARTLIRNPKILILDEPTTGLDPENTRLINDYIFSLDGITRIVISHDWTSEFLDRFDGIIRLGSA